MAIVTWGDEAYPQTLLHLHDPPPVLFLRGRVELLEWRSITVVGARRATVRSRDVAERLGGAAARAGICVTSGMALGIDGAAQTILRSELESIESTGRSLMPEGLEGALDAEAMADLIAYLERAEAKSD